MNILILNGSPKGENSITVQTLNYLQKKFPGQHWKVLHVGQKIKALEKNFDAAAEAVAWAEVLLFSYPVYTFIATSQLHRFVELLKERQVDVAGKIATQVTTSKHFYDITAHRYIQDNCADLGLRFVPGLSADMDDLTTEKGRREAENWWKHFLWSCEQGHFAPVYPRQPETAPAPSLPWKPGKGRRRGMW